MKLVATLATLIALSGICLLFIVIGGFGLQTLASNPSLTLHFSWNPKANEFGVLTMLVNSLTLSFSTLFVAFPLALGIACFLILPTKSKISKILQGYLSFLVRFMGSIPTVLYAFGALFLLIPLLRESFGGSGRNLLACICVLSLVILPTMILLLESGLKKPFLSQHLNGLALGMHDFETLLFVVIPKAKSVILGAFLLGLGRALGDTMIALMLSSNATILATSLFDPLRVLSAHIALITANESIGDAYNALFVSGFLLIVVNAILVLLARGILHKDSKLL
ncbi:ABC transporter permease subunit [Helicobacter sp. MIT 11-5569]|uniref:PstC family ABC transporter permease n=1 Tax=Helicobacter sp. MIT 11-5569 TaxID=1548151 RepID=UPI0006915CA7|nr:ABC transporter permease subunit [Helicobacter sp. MIT 11-5569]TLD83516.1 ABC transporter permease subunit [Helicobacter sp. MIT 11-5569]